MELDDNEIVKLDNENYQMDDDGVLEEEEEGKDIKTITITKNKNLFKNIKDNKNSKKFLFFEDALDNYY